MKQINPNDILSGLTVVDSLKEKEWAKNGYGCPKCDGYGNIQVGNGWTSCECKKAYYQRGRIKACGIPEHLFKTRTLSNYRFKGVFTPRDWDSLRRYSASYTPGSKGLVLWGNNGLGKTHVAIALAHQLLKRSHLVLYITARNLISELKNSFDKDSSDSEMDIKKKLLLPDILIIDDLSISKRSEWQLQVFEEIIAERYDSVNSTMIITTNLNFKYREDSIFPMFSVEAGPRIHSRIREMCHEIEFTGDDYRGKQP